MSPPPLPGAYDRRPLRDLGVLPTLLLARPILALLNRGEDPREALSREELFELVRRPADGLSAAMGNFLRIGAWMMVAAGGLAVFIPTAMIRAGTQTHLHPLPLTIMTVVTAVISFASGAILAGAVRLGVAWVFDGRLDRRFSDAVAAGRRPRGLVVRLGMPSHVDQVFAGLWALSLTLAFYEEFTAVPT